jgi:hypothetical protein
MLALSPGSSSAELAPEGGPDQHVLAFNEPTVAVDPGDPSRLAIADLGFLRVSTDGGESFSLPFLLQVPFGTYQPAGDPSLAYDSQGRLFWSYLGRRLDDGRLEVFVSQVDPGSGEVLPGYPVNVSAAAGFPTAAGFDNDKEWLAADRSATSSFRDRLHVVWTEFATGGVLASHSTDQGASWSQALTLSAPAEGFVWPVHVAVGPEGDVYVSYHSNVGGDGTSDQVFVARSSDGGASFPQKELAYGPGDADITFNEQGSSRTLDGSVSWTQGSAQAWVLADPLAPDQVYVVAADDPTNLDHGAGFDDMSVYIVRSLDRGLTWSTPERIDLGPEGTLQLFPTAGIADDTGHLTVSWWDTRAGATNSAGHFLLDVFVRSSSDGGLSFGPEFRVNDAPFDPDRGAVDRFPPSGTLRIGEYNGVAVTGDTAHLVFTGGLTGQRGFYDRVLVVPEAGSALGAAGALLVAAAQARRSRPKARRRAGGGG